MEAPPQTADTFTEHAALIGRLNYLLRVDKSGTITGLQIDELDRLLDWFLDLSANH